MEWGESWEIRDCHLVESHFVWVVTRYSIGFEPRYFFPFFFHHFYFQFDSSISFFFYWYTQVLKHKPPHTTIYICCGKYEFWVSMYTNQFVCKRTTSKYIYNLTYLHEKCMDQEPYTYSNWFGSICIPTKNSYLP